MRAPARREASDPAGGGAARSATSLSPSDVTFSIMKRLQIMIDEDLDAELGRRASRERTSKAALIRTYVRERVHPLPPIEEDPLWEMVGADDAEPARVDDVVYPR